ncbi:AAA family ATPase [Phreatobacter cathodiphilus]|uniref:Chromosome segregation protein SMC n=1 Tax=Phreatobacter cathodiphilus TaxID=1868589 RepID=A0A2S0N7B9_9HYPH|nr:ATP-binding protein [Phreatobacter cathodiphilus]AVO44050.1 chromosome segregation protein SMC [Phreatobacter cathodiphilus]
MLKTLRIRNYKSIVDSAISLGRVNVFIGANGAGKSNVLEAISLVGAARADRLDNEFLSSRGLRVSRPEHMRSAFNDEGQNKPILISAKYQNEGTVTCEFNHNNEPYGRWECYYHGRAPKEISFTELLQNYSKIQASATLKKKNSEELLLSIFKKMKDAPFEKIDGGFRVKISVEADKENPLIQSLLRSWLRLLPSHEALANFVVYSPENSSLQLYQSEGQIEPLGRHGEGLLKLLEVMQRDFADDITEIKNDMRMLEWFDDFDLIQSNSSTTIALKDTFFSINTKYLELSSANEGFLYLLFYFSLVYSRLTPSIFAIDNVETSLNPRLCQALMTAMSKAAKRRRKQLFITTHSPAVLDGLDISDTANRLFVVSRGPFGETRINQVSAPALTDSGRPRKLSSYYLDGLLGGLAPI